MRTCTTMLRTMITESREWKAWIAGLGENRFINSCVRCLWGSFTDWRDRRQWRC